MKLSNLIIAVMATVISLFLINGCDQEKEIVPIEIPTETIVVVPDDPILESAEKEDEAKTDE